MLIGPQQHLSPQNQPQSAKPLHLNDLSWKTPDSKKQNSKEAALGNLNQFLQDSKGLTVDTLKAELGRLGFSRKKGPFTNRLNTSKRENAYNKLVQKIVTSHNLSVQQKQDAAFAQAIANSQTTHNTEQESSKSVQQKQDAELAQAIAASLNDLKSPPKALATAQDASPEDLKAIAASQINHIKGLTESKFIPQKQDLKSFSSPVQNTLTNEGYHHYTPIMADGKCGFYAFLTGLGIPDSTGIGTTDDKKESLANTIDTFINIISNQADSDVIKAALLANLEQSMIDIINKYSPDGDLKNISDIDLKTTINTIETDIDVQANKSFHGIYGDDPSSWMPPEQQRTAWNTQKDAIRADLQKLQSMHTHHTSLYIIDSKQLLSEQLKNDPHLSPDHLGLLAKAFDVPLHITVIEPLPKEPYAINHDAPTSANNPIHLLLDYTSGAGHYTLLHQG